MRQIVKGSSVLTAVSIGEMVMRFVRTKLIALLLGLAGTGFLAQLAFFFEALRVWGDLGSRRAVIKQVAEQRFTGTASPAYRQVIGTSFFLTLAASAAVGAVVGLNAPWFSKLLYGDASHSSFIVFLAALLPAASLSTVIASIVKGNLDYMSFAKYTLGAYAAVILVIPVLIYFFREWGGAAAMGLFFIFPLFAYLLLNLRKRFLHFSKHIDRRALMEQFSYGFLQIYQDSLSHMVRIFVAAWIVRRLGLSAMGLYQVVLTFSTVYMAVPIQAMSGYVFPLMAGARDNEELNRAANDSLRFLLFVLVPVIVGVMIFPGPLIYLFYSRDFLPAVPVLQAQLFNALFLVMSTPFGAVLTARGKLKSALAGSTVYALFCFILSLAFFPRWQLRGIAVAYSAAGVILYLVYYAYARRHFGITLSPKNKKLVGMTLLWALLAYAGTNFFDHAAARVLLLFFGLPWFFISSKDHERRFLRDKIGAVLDAIRKEKIVVSKPA